MIFKEGDVCEACANVWLEKRFHLGNLTTRFRASIESGRMCVIICMQDDEFNGTRETLPYVDEEVEYKVLYENGRVFDNIKAMYLIKRA